MRLLCTLCVILSASGLRLKFDEGEQVEVEGPTKGGGKIGLHCSKQPLLPTECGPNDRWSHEELRATLDQFKDNWARRVTGGKLGANHQFAEWFLVKTLKPTAIIESGLLHGQSTWSLRDAAGPDTKIFSFDPIDQTSKGFHDQNPNTKYFTGQAWKDLGEFNFDEIIPREERSSALVILDDHQQFYKRFKALKELGFRHVFVEDNNKYGFGNTSPNFFCTKPELHKQTYAAVTPGVWYKDAAGPEHKIELSWEEHEQNLKFVHENMKTYFEFPAIWDVCQQRPSLFKTGEELASFGGLPRASDGYAYDHRYPPYYEIKQ